MNSSSPQTGLSAAGSSDSLNTSQTSGAEKKQVAESCFEFLFGAMLDVVALASPDLDSEAGMVRLERMGYGVGYRFLERCAQKRVLPPEPLEIIKFICKDFWTEVFKKQVDKLQTDHRGTFVLKDLDFRWMARYASDNSAENRLMVSRMLQFPCGLIRGALENLGINSVVRAEYTDDKNNITLPTCSFTIRTRP